MAKNQRLGLRLSEETYNTIKDYCKTNNVSQSEYIRELVEKNNEDLPLEQRISNIEYDIGKIKDKLNEIENVISGNRGY